MKCEVLRCLSKMRALAARVCWIALILVLIGCEGDPTIPADAFPSARSLPGWSVAEGVTYFDEENLYDLVNGQADAFFVYGFEAAGVQSYADAQGGVVRVTIWKVETPADAYGLFTANATGAPFALGNDGVIEPGRRLAFWQDRYLVWVEARQELPDTDLVRFAEAVATALPAGGDRPKLVTQLPPNGLVADSILFFHEEISIQSELWLGGENLLGLGRETDGVLARYESGEDGTIRLLVVQYPDTESALDGLAALESGQVEELIAADVHNDLLAAVFGPSDETAVETLLAEALR